MSDELTRDTDSLTQGATLAIVASGYDSSGRYYGFCVRDAARQGHPHAGLTIYANDVLMSCRW